MPEDTEENSEQLTEEAAEKEDLEKVEDEAASDKTVSAVQYDITSYGADYDVEGLVNRLNRDDIKIPPFQRNYIWKQSEASRFIESLLLGLPVPGIFLARETHSNKLLVIDGQQRLKTLQFFYKGFFNPKDDDTKKIVFRLINVQEAFEGKTFETLEEKDRVKLNDSLIHATIVKQELPKNDDTSIYHIFDRLNSEGRKLTPQEIRTAINHGPFIELLKELNENENWRKIYGKRSDRLKDQELILRFLAFFFESSSYKKPMNEFLNKFARKHREPSPEFFKAARHRFTSTIDVVWNSVGKRAFRLTVAINAAVFDSVMIGIASIADDSKSVDSESVRKAYEALLTNSDYIDVVSQSTSDEGSVSSRLEKARTAFENL